MSEVVLDISLVFFRERPCHGVYLNIKQMIVE